MKTLTMLLIAMLAVACEEKPRTLLHEEAVVEQSTFVPGQPCGGSGIGLDTDGSLSVHSFDCSTEDVYAVVFRCQHGKFVVRHGDRARETWEHVHAGDHVTNAYYEDSPGKFQFVAASTAVVTDGGVR